MCSSDLDFTLEEEKSGKIIADDEDGTEIGEYTVSTEGEIIVDIDGKLYGVFQEDGEDAEENEVDEEANIGKSLALLASTGEDLHLDTEEDQDEDEADVEDYVDEDQENDEEDENDANDEEDTVVDDDAEENEDDADLEDEGEEEVDGEDADQEDEKDENTDDEEENAVVDDDSEENKIDEEENLEDEEVRILVFNGSFEVEGAKKKVTILEIGRAHV